MPLIRLLGVFLYPSNVPHALPKQVCSFYPPVILIQRQDTSRTLAFLPKQRNVHSQFPVQSTVPLKQRL